MAVCPVCSEWRKATHKLCVVCRQEYGSDSKLFPKWIKALRALDTDYRRKPGGITGVPLGQRVRLVSLREDF